VDKDTPGGVRAACPPSRGGGGEQPAGVFRLSPVGEGGLSWAIDAPLPEDAEVPEVVDGAALERLSRALEDAAEPLSQTEARKRAKVREQAAGELLDMLAAGGYVKRWQRGQARMAEHVKPFRESDPLPGEVAK